MKQCDPIQSFALYEQRIKGLENVVSNKMQAWLFDRHWWEVSPQKRFPAWPNDYQLAAVFHTNDLDEAVVLSNRWDAWVDGDSKMIPVFPYGPYLEPTAYDFTNYLPRSISVGDVLVKPDGTVHMVRFAGFLEIARANRPIPAGSERLP